MGLGEKTTQMTKLTIKVENAKLNPKYYLARRFKHDKPRVRPGDISNFQHYCGPEGISVDLDVNTITFQKEIESDNDISMVLEGRDTGGQFMRLVVSYMINYGSGRLKEILPIELPKFTEEEKTSGKKGKATMLMVQMIKMTLGIGQTAMFRYGDVNNSDARHISEMPVLFDKLRTVFGINFRLDDDGNECYTLHRLEDVEPLKETILDIDNHMADEILFTAISLWAKGEDIPDIEIETPISWDYHIGAMVKFGKGIGMRIEDSKPEDGVKEWVSSGGVRIVKIFNEK